MTKLFIAVILIMTIISTGLVGVANGAAPGDPLYTIDRGMENLQISLTADSEESTQLKLDFAQERLDEIQNLVGRNQQEQAEQILEDLNLALASISDPVKPNVTSTPAEETELPATTETPDIEPTATPGESATPDSTTSPEGTPYPGGDAKNPSAGQRSGCGDATSETQPAAQNLADRYNVGYQEIMGWFCKGYGFGEIDLAYSLSQQAGLTPAEVFAKRAAGLGWGRVVKDLGLSNKAQKTPKPPKLDQSTPQSEDHNGNKPETKPNKPDKPDKDKQDKDNKPQKPK